MSVLFLDPLVLVAYACLMAYAWSVWRGSLRWWFGRGAHWTVVAWPLPIVTATTPVVLGALTAAADAVGLGRGDGGMVTTVVYLLAGLLPWTLGCVLPPRWLLPRWARERLVSPPSRLLAPVEGAIAAVHTPAGRGHGSRARWSWRVDGVPGFVWVEDGTVRFRALDAVDDPDPDVASTPLTPAPEDRGEPDDVLGRIARELGFERPAETDRSPPRVRVTADAVDVTADAVATWGTGATRPWRDDGLVTVTVADGRVVTLWVADVRPAVRTLRTVPLASPDGAR